MIGVLILGLITVVPIRIGAELFGAGNKNLTSCVIATVLGTALGLLSMNILGGLPGIIIAFILMSLTYSKVFQLSFSTSLKFTFVIIIIQIGCTQALVDFGLHIFTHNR